MAPTFAAIWKLSEREQKWIVVPVNHMKDFKPSNLDDFNRDQPYKYKPPGVPSSTYAFILALGESRDGLQSVLCKQRVKYPNKKRILDIINLHPSSTTEEDELFQSQKLNAKKEKGKAANMERIMQKVGLHLEQYKFSSKPVFKDKQEERSSQPKSTQSSLLFQMSKSPLNTNSSAKKDNSFPRKQNKESGLASMSVCKESSNPANSVDLESLKELSRLWRYIDDVNKQVADNLKKAEKARNEAEQQRIKAESIMVSVEEQRRLVAKDRKKVEDDKKAVEQMQSNILEAEGRFQNTCDDACATITAKVLNIKNVGSSKNVRNVLDESLPEVTVRLGYNVFANRDHWDQAKAANSKEVWAHHVLLAIFGSDAPFIRQREPRQQKDKDGNLIPKDPRLKKMPKEPQYATVLEKHFKAWLKANLHIVNEETVNIKKRAEKVAKKKAQAAGSDALSEINSDEEDEEAHKKFLEDNRTSTIATLVKGLLELLGNKAKQMYDVLGNRPPKSKEVKKTVNQKGQKQQKCEKSNLKPLTSRANSPADVHGGESNATTNTKSNSDPSMSRANFPADVHGAESDAMTINSDSSMSLADFSADMHDEGDAMTNINEDDLSDDTTLDQLDLSIIYDDNNKENDDGPNRQNFAHSTPENSIPLYDDDTDTDIKNSSPISKKLKLF